MQLKLKEDPREWRKFVWTGCAVLLVVSTLATRRHRMTFKAWESVSIALTFFAVLATFAPRFFRTPYRAVMTVSFHIGQVMQRMLLALVYLLVVTPLAVLLRVTGKDLLGLRKGSASTFWKPARKSGSFDQQF